MYLSFSQVIDFALFLFGADQEFRVISLLVSQAADSMMPAPR